MVSAMQAADKLDLKAITSGEFAASYVTGINPIDGTDLYASISNDGKQVISYSFKTGKQMSILFDVNAVKAPFEQIEGYVISPDGKKLLIMTRKNKFLVSRENYSYQLRDYLEQKGAGNRTCIVMFDFNQKKAEKKWNKLYARYVQKPKAKKAKNGQQMNDAPSPYQVKTINSTDFHFSSVQPNDEEVEEVKVKKAKKAKKEKRRKGAKNE